MNSIYIYIFFNHNFIFKFYSLRLFQQLAHPVLSEDGQKIFESLLRDINAGLHEDQQFTVEEAEAALKNMADRNEVMYTGGIVYNI